ncbi:hypothetical protein [Streptomyces sp. NBC_00191]
MSPARQAAGAGASPIATPQLVPVTIDGPVYRVPQRLAKAYERGLLRPEG